MKNPDLNVSVVQMTSVDSWQGNLEWIEALFETENLKNKDLVCFPENSLYFRINDQESIEFKGLDWPGFQRLGDLAKKHDSNIHLGSVPLEVNGQRYNSSVFIQKDGQIQGTYQKIHLFDIHLEGRAPIRESNVFAGGSSPQILHHGDWKIGQSICYDLRFSELYAFYAKKDVDMILIPAAFLVPTGKAHWDILVRARAIESQCYIIASCQAGEHRSQRNELVRMTYGNTMIVNPWGEVVARLADGVGILHATLNLGEVSKVRRQIPMKSHRRPI